jgi:site-specific DNA recombinase
MRQNEKIPPQIDKKSKIRERYKGIDESELDVIPAIPQEDFYHGTSEKRVAVYARVSTDDPRQTSSYELQKNHYTDLVSRRPDWKLIDIYADEGISGTSLQHRDEFLRMIDDCNADKIDLIVTKSVSRFARNIMDCIGYVRMLKGRKPPIGVFFETENIYTLDANSEMSLSFIATLAQEESHTKSEIMNASIEMRFKRGIFLTPALLGYDLDEDGNLIINEDEARTVRLIFFMYLYGYSTQGIAEVLTKLERPTKKGNTKWSSGSVLQILQNERHCGDVLARKTWTPNYLDHKPKKNKQDRNQYRQRDHHESIVSRDDFIAVQRLISNAKYGNKSILPELHVVKDGTLRGFVSINPRWAGFKVDDYYEACNSAYEDGSPPEDDSVEVEANEGDFDLRGYEIAHGQFFDTPGRISVTFSNDEIKFTMAAIRKLEASHTVELLIHPEKRLLAVRPVSKDAVNAITWSRMVNGKLSPKPISGTACLPTIFKLLGWKDECKYRLLGAIKRKDNEQILIFDLKDTEVLIPRYVIDQAGVQNGTDPDLAPFTAKSSPWDISKESEPYKESDIKVTDRATIESEIETMIEQMKETNANE